MSRAFTALLLVVSLVSGIFSFVPSNSAEYDEDFYEYQPFLQYDFNLHELDLKNYDENDPQEFSGSVYMRREYSTCLLYTSPSPRDTSSSRMPSSA